MISQKTQLKTELEKKEYIFHCESHATLTEVFQALDMFRNYIYGRIKDAEDQKAQAEKPQEQPVEKPIEEVILA